MLHVALTVRLYPTNICSRKHLTKDIIMRYTENMIYLVSQRIDLVLACAFGRDATNGQEEFLVEPFRIHVPDEVLDDLRVRLRRTRWPDQVLGIG